MRAAWNKHWWEGEAKNKFSYPSDNNEKTGLYIMALKEIKRSISEDDFFAFLLREFNSCYDAKNRSIILCYIFNSYKLEHIYNNFNSIKYELDKWILVLAKKNFNLSKEDIHDYIDRLDGVNDKLEVLYHCWEDGNKPPISKMQTINLVRGVLDLKPGELICDTSYFRGRKNPKKFLMRLFYKTIVNEKTFKLWNDGNQRISGSTLYGKLSCNIKSDLDIPYFECLIKCRAQINFRLKDEPDFKLYKSMINILIANKRKDTEGRGICRKIKTKMCSNRSSMTTNQYDELTWLISNIGKQSAIQMSNANPRKAPTYYTFRKL